jgi:hypothetical protein
VGAGTKLDILFNAKDVVRLTRSRCCVQGMFSINAYGVRVSFTVRVIVRASRLRTGMW